MTSIDRRLLAVARAGLPGAPPPPCDGWDGQLEALIANGLAGLFSAGAAAGMIDIDATMAGRLQRQLYSEAVRAVQIEGELVRLAPALEHLGAVVLKGAVLAHSAYLDPLLRPFTDLDLLVAGHRVPEAVALFATYGYRRTAPEPPTALDGLAGETITLEHPGGVAIWLHHNLVAGDLGDCVDVDGLLAARRAVRVGAHTLPAPSWEAHLVACALHAVVSDGLARPLSLRDVAEVAHHPSLDAGAAAELAVRWQVGEQVACGLSAARDGLGLELPGALAVLARHADDVPRWSGPVGSAHSHLDEPGNGDLRRRTTLVPSLVARSADVPARALGAATSPGAGLDVLELAPPPAVAPPALAASVTSPLATVGLAERPALGPVRTAVQRAAAGNPNGRGGRQAAWTGARPPRQGTTRARSRQGTPRADRDDAGGDDGDGDGPLDGQPASDPDPTAGRGTTPPTTNGVMWGIAGGALLAITVICSLQGMKNVGVVLVPPAALLLAGAASRRIARQRPDEAWVGRWLVAGVLVKLTASYLRYHTLVSGYEGVGDATGYHSYGRRFAAAWLGHGNAPELPDLRRLNFMRWFTGVVYYLFGTNMAAGFFVFGLLAAIGSYFWYRATADAVPGVDKRLYLGLVLFAPSIAFWPSSIGKESLMQLGIGTVALGASRLLSQKLVKGLVVGAAGGWLLWLVRPHLLALVTVAAGCAYLAGRVRASDNGVRSLLGRPVGLLAVVVLMAFTVSQGAKFLGIEDLSLSSIEAELDEQTERSAMGGSEFDNGGNSLNPIHLPQGAVTVLLRPFPWETDSPLQLLSSLESALLAGLIVWRLSSLRSALSRARSTPFVLYCWVLTILYAATFSSFANFGLLVRQRSLVLPALFVLLAVNVVPRPASTGGRPAPLTGGARAGR